MTLLFFHDHRADIGDQIVVRSPLSKQGAKVVIVLAEKTCAELAIRSQPDAGAVATKRLGHRGNEADFTGRAIGKAILAGGFAALVRYLLERPARSEEHTSELQSRSDLVCRLLLEKKKKKKYSDQQRITIKTNNVEVGNMNTITNNTNTNSTHSFLWIQVKSRQMSSKENTRTSLSD